MSRKNICCPPKQKLIPLTRCVITLSSLRVFKICLLINQESGNSITYFINLLWGLNEVNTIWKALCKLWSSMLFLTDLILLFIHTNFLINCSAQYIAEKTTGFPTFKFSKKEASNYLSGYSSAWRYETSRSFIIILIMNVLPRNTALYLNWYKPFSNQNSTRQPSFFNHKSVIHYAPRLNSLKMISSVFSILYSYLV